MVRVPSVDEEDLRRSHRERVRLVRERTAHTIATRACCSVKAFAHQREEQVQDIAHRYAGHRRWASIATTACQRDHSGDCQAVAHTVADRCARRRARPSANALQGHRTAHVLPIAVSSFGDFRAPAVRVRHAPQRPASENLHNLGRSTPSARIPFTPRPVDMMHDGECRIGLAAKGRMDVDQFFKVPAPHDEPFQ